MGRRVSERLMEDPVLAKVMVARRLAGLSSAEEFAAQWAARKEMHPKLNPEVDELWVAAVEAAVSAGVQLTTATIDLFVANGLYPKGVMETQRRLRRECERHIGVVAWSNTNSKSKDYRDALRAAHDSGRPVRFIRWKYELSAVPLQELFARDLRRFAAEGRYIPPHALAAAELRVDALYARTEGGDAGQLADAAGFTLLPDCRIVPHGRLLVPQSKLNKSAAGDAAAGTITAASSATTATTAATADSTAAAAAAAAGTADTADSAAATAGTTAPAATVSIAAAAVAGAAATALKRVVLPQAAYLAPGTTAARSRAVQPALAAAYSSSSSDSSAQCSTQWGGWSSSTSSSRTSSSSSSSSSS
eukprot:1205-Heterococcus_DN1.PRE.1